MFKNLKIFLSKNKKIINSNISTKKFILLADRQRFDSCVRQSLISKIFSDKGYTPILATSNPNSDFLEVYKSFGLEKIFNTSLYSNKRFFLINFLSFFLKTILTMLRHSLTNFEEFKSNFKISGVRYGAEIIDAYFRNHDYKSGFMTFKLFRLIFISYIKINLIKKFIQKNRIEYTVVSTDCYVNESSILFRVSESVKIKCIMSVRKIVKIYSTPNQYNEQFYIVKKEDLKKIKTKAVVRNYLKKRFQGKINHINVKDAYSGKIKSLKKKEFLKFFKLNEKDFRKIILFAPHAFADSCGAYGYFPFLGYYDFFRETYDKIKEIKDIFWIIKPHPSRYLYNEDNLIKNLIKNNKQKNISLCPDKISTKDLLEHVDTVVTGRGTIGVESAIFGKKPLTCGDTIYSTLNIAHHTKTKKDFFKKLNFKKLSLNLSKTDIFNAEKTLYFMGEYRWSQNSKIIPNIMDQKIGYFETYFKNLNKNLNNKSFLKDEFFIDLKKELNFHIK